MRRPACQVSKDRCGSEAAVQYDVQRLCTSLWAGLDGGALAHAGSRARYVIQTIARMVGNSASEPDATGSSPLDAWTVAALMGRSGVSLRFLSAGCRHFPNLTLAQAGSANGDDISPKHE